MIRIVYVWYIGTQNANYVTAARCNLILGLKEFAKVVESSNLPRNLRNHSKYPSKYPWYALFMSTIQDTQYLFLVYFPNYLMWLDFPLSYLITEKEEMLVHLWQSQPEIREDDLFMSSTTTT